jgi:hypothetical protein
MWLSKVFELLISDEHAWAVGSKPSGDLQMWDGFTLNGGILFLHIKNNVFLSVLEEMQNPNPDTCFGASLFSENPLPQSSCLRFRNIASFDLRLAATLRSFLSVSSVHREEILRGAIRASQLFRHAPPTAEVLDLRWHEAAFPRCAFVHKLPQMMQEFREWDLSCSALPSKSWLKVAGCPAVKPLAAPSVSAPTQVRFHAID